MTPEELELHKTVLRHLKGLTGAYEALIRQYDIPFAGHAQASSATQQRKNFNVKENRSRAER